MKTIFRLIAKIIGWKIVGEVDASKKNVLIIAPHTSNWDLPLGLILYGTTGNKVSFFIKKSWFFFPMNLLIRALGGVPVDRSKKNSLTQQMVDMYNARDEFHLAIAPEGTRQANPDWKKGFYFIALEAKVPIVVIAFDYKNKEAQFKKTLMASGDIEVDMAIIKKCYEGVTARYPDKFAL